MSVLIDAHEDTPHIEIFSVSDTVHRCWWTDDENVQIVEESHRESVTMAEVARRHEILQSMIFVSRYWHKLGLLSASMTFVRQVPMNFGIYGHEIYACLSD